VTGGASLGTLTSAKVTIEDVAEAGTLAFGSAVAAVTEGSSVTLTINRSGGTDGSVTFTVSSISGSAIAGSDFTALDQVVTIPAGQNSASVNLSTLDRSGSQGSRYFDVVLGTPTSGATLGDVRSVRVTINDQTVQPPSEQTGGGGGGAIGWWMMLVLASFGMFRRKGK
jgi:hypothetical protein